MTNKRKYLIQVALCWCMLLMPVVAEDAKVLFLAGADSHSWGTHEHHAGAKLLAKALSESGLGIRAEVVEDFWPEDASALDGLKALVVFCDGKDSHMLNGHAEEVASLQDDGVGLVCIHYAVEVNPGDLRKTLMDGIGGYFETNWSVNPTWTPAQARLGEHPITRGVDPFEIEDEWYYHMRFRPDMAGVTPILSALPALDTLAEEDGPRNGNPALREELKEGKWQHLAWASANENDSRGFGFTGAHIHSNWSNDNFRKLVLNGIVWAAGLTVPPDGVPSETPIIVRNETLMHAIVKGDAKDVEQQKLTSA